MEPDKTPNDPTNPAQYLSERLIEILLEVRSYASTSNNLLWTYYDSANEIAEEIDGHIEGVKSLDIGKIALINVLFMPTADFQTIAIDNGWGDAYLDLASRFDNVYAELLVLLKARHV